MSYLNRICNPKPAPRHLMVYTDELHVQLGKLESLDLISTLIVQNSEPPKLVTHDSDVSK